MSLTESTQKPVIMAKPWQECSFIVVRITHIHTCAHMQTCVHASTHTHTHTCMH